uniref:LRAT domain-containing protein n=1 Tax=Leptobrachium leishanense TaxID=445787 RepID=A0A8C5R6F3_9ANUR
MKGKEPQPGDLIEFHRVGYQHWGICVEHGYVVHLTDLNGGSIETLVSYGPAVVRKDPLDVVAGKSHFVVNKKYDEKMTPLPAEYVVKAALENVGQTVNYNIITNNCEHFVTQLKYGTAFSDQVKNAVTCLAVAVVVLVTAGVVFAVIKSNPVSLSRMLLAFLFKKCASKAV